MFKHIKFLQGGSDRYHGILVSIEGLWPNLVSVHCTTVGEVSGPVFNHEHSCLSGTRTGPDSHGICRHLHYPSVDHLDE